MVKPLHITSGDCAGRILERAGLPGEVLVWRDVLYGGLRCSGWPDQATIHARAAFLAEMTAGGLDRQSIAGTLQNQYRMLEESSSGRPIVLWFDACLFDQSMLAHILTCLRHQNAEDVTLLCVESFPGIEPFHGLGQLQPHQLAALYDNRAPVTDTQFEFAVRADCAFATQESGALTALSQVVKAPLPWIPAAAARWLQELPDAVTGLGRLETLALTLIRGGCETPDKIFASVAAADTPPQFWGDTTLWAKINSLADRDPPLVEIDGPAGRLPQWESELTLSDFRIRALPSQAWQDTACLRP